MPIVSKKIVGEFSREKISRYSPTSTIPMSSAARPILEISARVRVPKLLHRKHTMVRVTAMSSRCPELEATPGSRAVPRNRLAAKSELNRAVLVIPIVMQAR